MRGGETPSREEPRAGCRPLAGGSAGAAVRLPAAGLTPALLRNSLLLQGLREAAGAWILFQYSKFGNGHEGGKTALRMEQNCITSLSYMFLKKHTKCLGFFDWIGVDLALAYAPDSPPAGTGENLRVNPFLPPRLQLHPAPLKWPDNSFGPFAASHFTLLLCPLLLRHSPSLSHLRKYLPFSEYFQFPFLGLTTSTS